MGCIGLLLFMGPQGNKILKTVYIFMNLPHFPYFILLDVSFFSFVTKGVKFLETTLELLLLFFIFKICFSSMDGMCVFVLCNFIFFIKK